MQTAAVYMMIEWRCPQALSPIFSILRSEEQEEGLVHDVIHVMLS